MADIIDELKRHKESMARQSEYGAGKEAVEIRRLAESAYDKGDYRTAIKGVETVVEGLKRFRSRDETSAASDVKWESRQIVSLARKIGDDALKSGDVKTALKAAKIIDNDETRSSLSAHRDGLELAAKVVDRATKKNDFDTAIQAASIIALHGKESGPWDNTSRASGVKLAMTVGQAALKAGDPDAALDAAALAYAASEYGGFGAKDNAIKLAKEAYKASGKNGILFDSEAEAMLKRRAEELSLGTASKSLAAADVPKVNQYERVASVASYGGWNGQGNFGSAVSVNPDTQSQLSLRDSVFKPTQVADAHAINININQPAALDSAVKVERQGVQVKPPELSMA